MCVCNSANNVKLEASGTDCEARFSFLIDIKQPVLFILLYLYYTGIAAQTHVRVREKDFHVMTLLLRKPSPKTAVLAIIYFSC